MIFSSITFLYFFLPAVLLFYFILPSKAKNSVLFISSVFFYAWGEKLLALLFIFAILIGWILGLLIEYAKNVKNNKLCKSVLIIAAIIDLGLLCYFKYTDFFIDSFNSLFKTNIPLLRIALPIGISFYIFQLLSYEIDVYRGTVKAQRNFINFATYVSMFPQLIAGPIVRYCDIENQLQNRTHSLKKVYEGTARFIIGFSKKIMIANTLGELTVFFRNSNSLSVLYYWLYAIAFMLQIYYDFSGYSDMAIGLGKIFGFDFNENFNYPYISKSITEFWRRWHISLGSWFRDYVYIPLGGNKKGIVRQIINILIVWMLTGLWHGAAWNFILWGLLYAFLLILEKLFLKKILEKLPVINNIYVLFTVMLGFVLFNAPDLKTTLQDIGGLVGLGKVPLYSKEAVYYLRSYGVTILIGIICATPLLKNIYMKINSMDNNKLIKTILMIGEPIVLLIMVVTGTAFLIDGSFNPFLYFRF